MAQNQTRGTIVKPEHMQTMLNEVVDMLPKKFSAADLSILIPHIVLSYGMEESWPQIIMYSTKTLGENLCEDAVQDANNFLERVVNAKNF
jgi:hypothetical protein